jgi:hypothetical protein
MTEQELLATFLDKVSAEYPKHMFHFFADRAARGILLPFTKGLLRVVGFVESSSPGYAAEMLERIAAVQGIGESQYEALLAILAEIYVTGGLLEQADHQGGKPLFVHEPGPKGKKTPEFEVCVSGYWFAIEVKTPGLIQHRRLRSMNSYQAGVRLPKEVVVSMNPMRPKDSPVKNFLVSAEEKFAVYEAHRNGAFRLLVIVWDDFCNEPIAALTSPVAGLLTAQSFSRDNDDNPVRYPHVDGVIVIRYQHQIIRATQCRPLIDGATEPLLYRHEGFPPKAFIEVPGGRSVPDKLLEALNATPLSACLGAEYQPLEMIKWMDS